MTLIGGPFDGLIVPHGWAAVMHALQVSDTRAAVYKRDQFGRYRYLTGCTVLPGSLRGCEGAVITVGE